ncbi:uncharacterized protein LOC131232576 isoform X1 [Magnolia sinica]|uniref:uncharacterized protein LOC131232576 isoform X1 n=1 Tax=Magnolia sinica TaxID=86752 RepID=UPI002659C738|nr:uncharacterized protein LOC131232576 isoform X1 [Magnolia sinica]
MAQNNIPVIEVYWSLVDKADRKFSRVRDLAPYGKNRYDMYFHKVFKIYTQLWKFQQENRQKLVEAGLKRWEIGEIASRIAQLYYGQYLRTSDASYLSESYIFYEAIMSREYFKDGSPLQDLSLAGKQLRYLARFMIVCLVLNRREMAHQLVNQLRMLVDECKRNFPDMDFKDWKQVVQEIVRFLKADTSFMNIRPLRYSLVLDPNPDSLPYVACVAKRGLRLQEAILSSYRHNEVKFTELTLDTFRMLQCLEWEPSGSFYQTRGAELSVNGPSVGQNGGVGPNRATFPQEITDPTLPPNPRKAILYRPAVTHFIAVLATICEELPHQGILLIYLSAAGKGGQTLPFPTGRGTTANTTENIVENFQSLDVATDTQSTSPVSSDSSTSSSVQNKGKSSCGDGLWLGSRGNGGLDCLYPCDLIPFTRRPLFLIIDSDSSHEFKALQGAEKGETAVMLLSPCSPSPPATTAVDFSRHQNGSQFTMFLTAPLQAFCHLIGYSGSNIQMDVYNSAEKLLSSLLNEWGLILATSDFLDPVWAEILSDPFLRRLLLRFIFCRAVLALYERTFNKKEYHPECLPHLPESVLPASAACQSAILRLANIFGAASHFIYSDIITPHENETCSEEPAIIKASDIHEGHFAAENGH